MVVVKDETVFYKKKFHTQKDIHQKYRGARNHDDLVKYLLLVLNNQE